MFTSSFVAERVGKLDEKYPFAVTETIGTSRLGKPLHALIVGYGERAVGINAAHHANEWITAGVLIKFLEDYCEKCANESELLENVTLYAVPMVNPDGADGVISGELPPHWKANACGVDLNANYPACWEAGRGNKAAQGYDSAGAVGFPGDAPLCEPESSAMAAYTRLRDFALTISLHTQGEEIYHRYRHYRPAGADEIAARMAQVSGYANVDVPGESAHGGYRDWFIQEFNRPGFTIECGLGGNPLPIEDFDAIYEKVSSILWIGVGADSNLARIASASTCEYIRPSSNCFM